MLRRMVFAGLVSVSAFGQAQTPRPAFEVATVKPGVPGARGMSVDEDNQKLSLRNVTLKRCLGLAYNVKEQLLFGPDWLDTERYDIVAIAPRHSPENQVPLMLQALLAERFQLVVHQEKKTVPVYALVQAKSGPKFQPVEASGDSGMSAGRGRIVGRSVSMTELTDALSRRLELPVFNMTELMGVYDLKLEWTPETPQPPESTGPSIFTALEQQLGLKLESRKMPADVIVVDHVNKVPTAN